MRVTGLKPAQLAAHAGISTSTLTRFLADDYDGTLSPMTISRLVDAFEVETPRAAQINEAPSSAAATEASLLSDTERAPKELAELLTGKSNTCELWRINSTALEHIGLLPGDMVILDTQAIPQTRDIVLAEQHAGALKLLWRIYLPPFLVGASREIIRHKPILIDDTITIRGVMVGMARKPLVA